MNGPSAIAVSQNQATMPARVLGVIFNQHGVGEYLGDFVWKNHPIRAPHLFDGVG